MLNFIRAFLSPVSLISVLGRVANDTRLLRNKTQEQEETLRDVKLQINAITLSVGHILALTDPNYSRDESSPEVIAESDEISRRVIDKLLAEQAARDHTTGTVR